MVNVLVFVSLLKLEIIQQLFCSISCIRFLWLYCIQMFLHMEKPQSSFWELIGIKLHVYIFILKQDVSDYLFILRITTCKSIKGLGHTCSSLSMLKVEWLMLHFISATSWNMLETNSHFPILILWGLPIYSAVTTRWMKWELSKVTWVKVWGAQPRSARWARAATSGWEV